MGHSITSFFSRTHKLIFPLFMTRKTKIHTSKEKLLPEYIRALEFLDSKLDTLNPTPIEDISTNIWKQGSIHLFEGPFSARNLPSGKNWRWNQTKARKQATSKRNVRDACSVPGFKMWQFEITTNKFDEPFYVVWCEKGTVSKEKEIPQEYCSEVEEEEEEKENFSSPYQVEMTVKEFNLLNELLNMPEEENEHLFSWAFSNNSFEFLLSS